MPKCPHCNHEEDDLKEFVYTRTLEGESGFNLTPDPFDEENMVDFELGMNALICPECDSILGGL